MDKVKYTWFVSDNNVYHIIPVVQSEHSTYYYIHPHKGLSELHGDMRGRLFDTEMEAAEAFRDLKLRALNFFALELNKLRTEYNKAVIVYEFFNKHRFDDKKPRETVDVHPLLEALEALENARV